MRRKTPHYWEWPGPSASSNRGKGTIWFIQCDILDTQIHLKSKRKKTFKRFKNLFITDIYVVMGNKPWTILKDRRGLWLRSDRKILMLSGNIQATRYKPLFCSIRCRESKRGKARPCSDADIFFLLSWAAAVFNHESVKVSWNAKATILGQHPVKMNWVTTALRLLVTWRENQIQTN